jgi:hypothetical protein
MGITFSPECGSNFEPEPEEGERKRDRVRSPRGPGRPRKDPTLVSAPVKSQVRARVPRFEDFDKNY